jgi:hypothetical protein
MFWRDATPVDEPRVLRALRDEPAWRILAPALSAAEALRGRSPAFDQASSAALARIARDETVDEGLRREAVAAIGTDPSPADLRLELELMRELPPPVAAAAALVLLETAPEMEPQVREAARAWPASDTHPIRYVRWLLEQSAAEPGT